MPSAAGKAFVLFVCLVTLSEAGARAQLSAPPGWKWITDSEARLVSSLDPAEGTWLFGVMAPGWHITTRPGATLFDPAYSGRGRFVVESEIFLFPGSSQAGFGVFVGGRNLESGGQYVAFLLRRDGSAAIESMDAGRSVLLHPWTPSAAVVPGKTAGDPVKNVLRVEAEATAVTFYINGQKAADTPRDASRFDGIVGLRVGSDLNLHVTNLDLTHRLALPRPVKK
jgi:hypothetical protein